MAFDYYIVYIIVAVVIIILKLIYLVIKNKILNFEDCFCCRINWHGKEICSEKEY